MAKLILSMDGLVLKEIPLSKDPTHLGRTNGPLVEGNPVKKHFLQNNDVVELGKYRLKFVGEAPVPAATAEKADFEKTMVLRPSAMRAAAEQARTMGAAGAEAARAAAAQQVAASSASAGTVEKEARPAPAPMSATATTPTPS